MSKRPSSNAHKLQMSYILNSEDRSRSEAPTIRSPDPDRKFVCQTCKFPFRSKGDMQKHIKTVHLGIKDHQCLKCRARFAEKGNLTKHMKRHEGARVWKCNISGCAKNFVLRDGLARHQKFVHGVQDPSSLSRSPTSASKSSSSTTSRPTLASRPAAPTSDRQTPYHTTSRPRK